jgi:hypothetical protein
VIAVGRPSDAHSTPHCSGCRIAGFWGP